MKRRALRGAVRGLVATAPMSAVFLAQRAGRVPPEEVFKRMTARAHGQGLGRLWPLAHLAIGATFGAAAEAVNLPSQRSVRTAYGAALFFVDYALVAPRLHLYPQLHDDLRRRRRINLLSHAVYGFALGRGR